MYNQPSRGGSSDPRKQSLDYRYHLTHDLLTNLHRGECCAVVGVGSCGKSRLLRHITRPETLEYHLAEGGYDHMIVLVECNAWVDNTNWAAYEAMASNLSEALETSTHPTVRSIRRDLTGLHDAVAKEPMLAFKHMMTGLGALLNNTTLKLTFCFDEFDFVFEKFDAQLFRNLRAMRNAHKYQLTFLLATRMQVPYQRPSDQWPDVEEFYELFSDNTFAIGPYDEKDATEMVVDLEARYEFALKTRTRQLLIDVTGGHPGLIGASFRLLEQGHLQPATQQEMARLLNNEPTTWKECRKIWEPLRPDEHVALKRVASNGRLKSTDLQVVQELKSKGLVHETSNRGSAEIFSPIFQEFIRHVDD